MSKDVDQTADQRVTEGQPPTHWPESAGVPDDALDARGLKCPEPLLLVRNRLRELAPDALLHVLATDPSTHRDFEQLCRFVGHRLEGYRQVDGVFEFLIRRKP